MATSRFERACATQGFAPFDLKTLLGDSAYSRAEGMLRTGNSARRERLRNEAHGADPLARGARAKTARGGYGLNSGRVHPLAT